MGTKIDRYTDLHTYTRNKTSVKKRLRDQKWFRRREEEEERLGEVSESREINAMDSVWFGGVSHCHCMRMESQRRWEGKKKKRERDAALCQTVAFDMHAVSMAAICTLAGG